MNSNTFHRRAFLSLAGKTLLAGTTSLSGAALSGVATRKRDDRPNIVLIMADDMGFSDIGCFGGEIRTPNLDRLAKEGARFTQFYNVARCCPTRAALLTGLYPHQAGIGHMVDGYAKALRERINSPAYTDHLSESGVTLAEALKGAGYKTLMTGKWHVGHDRPHWPVDRGFDRYYGVIGGASNYFDPGSKQVFALDDKPLDAGGGNYYTTDAFTDYALRFLDEHGHRPEPFFLYLAYTAPHWPLHARPEDIAKYRGKYKTGWDALRAARRKRQIEGGIADANWPLTPRDERVPAWETLSEAERDAWDLKMAVYAAQIDRMDQNIGRVLDRLKTMGVEDNTLVLFLSDNGACAELIHRGKPDAPPGTKESFDSYGIGWANLGSTPFRLYKHWTHEGGIATPLVARWPRGIRPGGLSHEPGHVIDVMATCLDVAGAAYPKKRKGHSITPMEGVSLRPAFNGKPLARPRPLFWEHEGNRAVRDGKWKLVSRYEPGDWELYDMDADRTEMNDVSARHPERVRAMAAQYDRWAERVGVVPWAEAQGERARQPAQN